MGALSHRTGAVKDIIAKVAPGARYFLLLLWISVSAAFTSCSFRGRGRGREIGMLISSRESRRPSPDFHITSRQVLTLRFIPEEHPGCPVVPSITSVPLPPSLVPVEETVVCRDNPPEIVNIRVARANEYAEIVRLRVKVFYSYLATVSSYHQEVLEKMQHRITRGAVLLIAKREMNGEVSRASKYFGNVVGTVEFSHMDFVGTAMEHIGARRKLYVYDLAIRDDARRMGLARSMLQSVETYAVANDFHALFLHVDKDNSVALEFYRRHGWEHVGESAFATLFTEQRLHRDASQFHFLFKCPGKEKEQRSVTYPRSRESLSLSQKADTQRKEVHVL